MNKLLAKAAVFGLLSSFALAAMPVLVPKGTQVTLTFDQAMSSKTAKIGDAVKLKVAKDVIVNGKTILSAGTPVSGAISEVKRRGRFGVNGNMQVTLTPANGVPLIPRRATKDLSNKTGEAAAASGAGALVLGPIGLVGGYFIVGKEVNINAGDSIETEVSKDVWVNR